MSSAISKPVAGVAAGAVIGDRMGHIAALVSMTLATALLAGAPADAQTLRVLRTGLGEGQVTGVGIACGADCNEAFGAATSVELTAAALTGSNFAGWGGDCAGTATTCTVSVNAVTSVRAEFVPSTPIPELTDCNPTGDCTPAQIAAYLLANPSVNTAAEFMQALPVEFRQNWILMVRSESLQTGIATSPRILMPSADSRRVFTIGMTQHSSYPGSHPNAIEYMQWDATQNNFRFHEIVLDTIPALGDVVETGPPEVRRFPLRSRGVSIDDAKCFACHSTRNVLNRDPTPGTDGIPPGTVGFKSKPNWDTYDSWGGMLSFNRDRIYQGSVEAAAFRKIFNLWTWQGNDTVRSIIERLELQPPGVPAAHVITPNTGGGANNGHISFPFDGGAIVTKEPAPVGTPGADGSTNYAFDGAVRSGGASTFARDGNFITLHHSLSPGSSPTSDEGRGVDLFDQLFGQLNPARVADEVVNHSFATGSVPFDVKPLALAVAQRCIAVAGGTDIPMTQTITSAPALSPAALSALAFFNQRHGASSFDQVYDDTRLRQAYLTLRKADIQKITLDRTIDPYAYDSDTSGPPPPPAIIDGLVQTYGADTELFNPGTPLNANQLLERIRAEVFRRRTIAGDPNNPPDSTFMGGVYVDREDLETASQMALFRYFLEPLGVSVDKWSIGVRGRSRTYTMADVFMGIYNNALAGRIKPALGLAGLGMTDTCTQVIPMVEASVAALPPATGPGAMPKYTDIQRIFNKSCIECHGGLGYPPYQSYFLGPPEDEFNLSEDEDPPAGERRLERSWRSASSFAGTSASSSYLMNRITDGGRLAHPYDPDEPYNLSNPDDPADPDVLDERCPYGVMPCGGPPLSWVDIETIRRWVEGGATYSEGDPHLRTIDGTNYDFQGAGEYVLLRDEGLELQARLTAVATAGPLGPDGHTGLTSCVSVNTAVAVRMGTQRITYQPNLSGKPDPDGLHLRIDGKQVNLGSQEIRLASGGRILRTPAQGGIQIQSQGGTAVIITPAWWDHHQIWYMNVNVRQARATDGLMGSIAPNEWLPALPDGSLLGPRPGDLGHRYAVLYDKFGNAWRVDDDTTLFDYAPGESTDTFTDKTWPRGEAPESCVPGPLPDGNRSTPPQKPLDAKTASRLCEAVRDKARKANCMQDVMVTGERGFAKTYVATEDIERNRAPSSPVLSIPRDFRTDLGTPVAFVWRSSRDRDGDDVTYRLCIWSVGELFGFHKCDAKAIKPTSPRRPVRKTVSDLESGRAYFWKVIAEDGKGGIAESNTRRMSIKKK